MMAAPAIENPFLASALAYVARGWKVFPCWWPTGDGCSCARGLACERIGKHPLGRLVPNGLLDATSDPDIVTGWWRQYPSANIAIRTGAESGFWVVDVDAYKGGAVSLEILEAKHAPLPTSLRARTGSGGASTHICFAYPGNGYRIPSHPLAGTKGLDVKGAGGYIIVAPSLHRSGGVYCWLDEDISTLEEAPAWLLRMVSAPAAQEPKAPVPTGLELDDEAAEEFCSKWFARAARKVEAGEARHDTAGWLFVQFKDNAVPYSYALTWIGPFLDLARETGDSRQVTEAELLGYLNWAYSKERRDPLPSIAKKLGAAEPLPPPEVLPGPFPWLSLASVREEMRTIMETRRPTGIPGFDKALAGGLPGGTVVSLVGPPGSCKSVLAIQLALDRARAVQGIAYVYSPDQGGMQPLERIGTTFGDLVGDDGAFAAFMADIGPLLRVADERETGVTMEAFAAAVIGAGDAAAVVIDTPQTVVTRADEDGERGRIDSAMEQARTIARAALVPVLVPSHANRASVAAKRKEDRTRPGASALGSAKVEHRSQVLLFMERDESDRVQGTVIDVIVPKVTFGTAGAKFRLALDVARWRLYEVDRTAEAEEEEERVATERARKVRDISEKVVKLLRRFPDGLSGRDICQNVKGRTADVMETLSVMQETFVIFGEKRAGRGGGIIWKLAVKS